MNTAEMTGAQYNPRLVDLRTDPTETAELLSYAGSIPSVQLSQRELCDLEMLASGAFSPLWTFMSAADYKSVLETMRLCDGTLFPIPITLSAGDLAGIKLDCDIALRGPKNDLLAIMSVADIYETDHTQFADSVLGTLDPRHPMLAEVSSTGRFNLSGPLRVMRLPEYHDFRELRLTPLQTRERLASMGRSNVVAFHTRNPVHRAHEEMMKKATEMMDSTLLLHPAVGMTNPGDVEHVTRVRTYKAFADACFAKGKALLSIIPLAMRMAGPREALLHAIIRRNYGATHFIVGRDHASPGLDSNGNPFYEPLAAQELARSYAEEIGVEVIAFPEMRYFPKEDKWVSSEEPVPIKGSVSVSGTAIRRDYLAHGKSIPGWIMRKQVSEILSGAFPARNKQGVCIWFTGLSAAGKSTTAEILTMLLQEHGRQISVLDGDVVRTHLSKGLGFSREDRDANISRIGFVASEIVRHGGVAICAAISPYRESRNKVRTMFEPGNFIEVFVDTPLEVCEARDPKGMYAMSRRGEIVNFTGTDDIYETPGSPELILDTVERTARENAESIVEYLRTEGFLAPHTQVATGSGISGGGK